MDWQILAYLGLSFLLPFLAIVFGVHYERWQREKRRKNRPAWSYEHPHDWRGM
jgi:hypothetical protein